LAAILDELGSVRHPSHGKQATGEIHQ